MLQGKCPECQNTFRIESADWIGKIGVCPFCQKEITIALPSPRPVPPRPAPPRPAPPRPAPPRPAPPRPAPPRPAPPRSESGEGTKKYFILSILVTACCCVPLGIPAIVFSQIALNREKEYDYEGAQANLEKAKLFLWLAFGGGILANLLGMFCGLLSAL